MPSGVRPHTKRLNEVPEQWRDVLSDEQIVEATG